MTDQQSICKKLRELRKSKNATQSEVATACGIHSVSYSRYENGERYPDVQQLKALAKYFGVTIDFLVE